MEFTGSIIELIKTVSSPIKIWWKYHRGINKYMKTLIEKNEELNCRKQDQESRKIIEFLPEESRRMKRQKKEVELWLGKVDKMNEEVDNIKLRVKEASYLGRSNLGKIVFSKIREVEELYRKGVFVDGLVEVVPQSGDVLPTRKLLEGETTFARKLEEVWDCLMKEEVTKVGVYGMSGIGKTTILKHINNRIMEHDDKFDNVIWVTVSKASSDIIMLQDAIARKLNIDIARYDDETSRAAKLYEALNGKRRFVLILDDLWEVYNLEDVGIPEPTLVNGCKLVLSTQFLPICNGMSCRSVRMELLTQAEAWTLFVDIVGHEVLSISNLGKIVQDIVEECARLPLAIVTIAGSLKGVVNYCEWNEVLEELREVEKGSQSSGTIVIQKLKLSYNRLKDKKLQDCLLYCALYPEDSVINRRELIEDLIVEGIIERKNSRRDEFEKGHAMLNKLEKCCLLEGSSNKTGQRFIKMHDLVRDMAISVSSVDRFHLVEAGIGLKEIPSEEKWTKDLVRVSLMHNNISTIPPNASPKCQSLSTLVLRHNKLLEEIPNCFFVHMKSLNVLDLSFTNIKNLPFSISNLVNLKALLLRGCEELEILPSLINLRALMKLDCGKSGIRKVPEGIEIMVNLRYLDLHSKNLKTIPDGTFCKLSHIQHLVLPQHYSRTLRVNVNEIATLRKLEVFRASFLDIDHFNAFVKSFDDGKEMVSSYTLHVGFHCFVSFYRCSRGVILTHCNLTGDSPLLLPKCTQVLHVIGCFLACLCSLAVSLKNTSDLRQCILSECSETKYILYSSALNAPMLQRLEKLELDRLWNLRGLVMNDNSEANLLPIGTFSSLNKLSIVDCPNMKSLFTLALLSYLQNLEEIKVHKCEKMVEIVTYDDKCEDTLITLPKLRILRLWGLPKLKSISSYNQSNLVVNSLEEMLILKCPDLKRIDPIFGNEPASNHPSLHKIKVEKKWWESLEWDRPSDKNDLDRFCMKYREILDFLEGQRRAHLEEGKKNAIKSLRKG